MPTRFERLFVSPALTLCNPVGKLLSSIARLCAFSSRNPLPLPPTIHLSSPYPRLLLPTYPYVIQFRYESILHILHFPGPLQCCSPRLQRQNGDYPNRS